MLVRTTLSIVATFTLLFLMLPLIIVLGSSVSNTEFMAFPPQGMTLKWYAKIFTNTGYVNAFVTSTSLALFATLIAVLIAIPSSLVFSRFKFMGKQLTETILMSPLVLPYIVLGAAFLQYGTQIGFVRSFPSLLVSHAVIVIPFVVRSILPQLTLSQQALEEASRDLGAGAFETFIFVTLPQIKSGVISGAVLAFITSWINVEITIFQATPNLTTIPVVLFNYVQYTVDPSISAVSAVTILLAAALIIMLDLMFGINVIAKRK